MRRGAKAERRKIEERGRRLVRLVRRGILEILEIVEGRRDGEVRLFVGRGMGRRGRGKLEQGGKRAGIEGSQVL
jgi:hypothetical protein